jgi:hypothetical protein
MAVSFFFEAGDNLNIKFTATGGRYEEKEIKNLDYKKGAGREKYSWWLRKPVTFEWVLEKSMLSNEEDRYEVLPKLILADGNGEIELNLVLRVREMEDKKYLCTAALINRNSSNQTSIDKILFQSLLKIEFEDPKKLLPYPESKSNIKNLEDKSLHLLCCIYGTHLPEYEEPLYTPDITDLKGKEIQIEMASLAGLHGGEDPIKNLKRLVDNYEEWINNQEDKIKNIPNYKDAAYKNIENCKQSIERMRQGIELLINDTTAYAAFKLANHSILIQQIRRKHRKPKFQGGRIKFENFPDINPLDPGSNVGKWRPFQIAFILMSLSSTLNEDDPFHDNVELIWFPTGGGKTEAYLGLAAVSMFYRILNDKSDKGVNVIMRYTLRLLTAQQFQRASRLICAMNYVYDKEVESTKPFSIGIWVGGTTTSNTRYQARKALNTLKERGPYAPENPFLLTECPWCGAKMGPLEDKFNDTYPVLGYDQIGNNVTLKCPDINCTFNDGLKIYTIDEEIYDKAPTFVIGTVDKFARLAWEPDSKHLFGNSDVSPPQLIIQDELHLISGPLGSMVGLYETLIENLCTNDSGTKPKIVCSTATIRRYREQIKSLFARKQSTLFPHPEIEMGNAFFARYLTDNNGDVILGKKYVGIHAPSLGSMQTTQVRVFSALAQSPNYLDKDDHKDPWWTQLLFYNSLRELGGAYTLFKSDIPEYLYRMSNKRKIDKKNIRYPNNVLELTGRASSKEVYRALERLETVKKSSSDNYPIDVCLASNIIEVGVDVDRLGVLGIVGQPKTSAQYIQVAGRVGRKPKEKPGLVVTLYSSSKPRDRSHFEKFRTYHEKIYTQVEPTSVTPFSPQVLEKALFGLMVAYVRQSGIDSPDPYPEKLLDRLKEILIDRVKIVNEDNYSSLVEIYDKYKSKWKESDRIEWKAKSNEPGLIYAAGSYVEENWKTVSQSVPNSMRNVDQECRLYISPTNSL